MLAITASNEWKILTHNSAAQGLMLGQRCISGLPQRSSTISASTFKKQEIPAYALFHYEVYECMHVRPD